jgi:hypothetical protein
MLPLGYIEDQIMEWAKEHEASAYAQTLGVQEQRRTYRRYMQRLVEIRWDNDPGWDPPLRLLEDTNIAANFKANDGTVFRVQGRRCEGLRKMSWTLMAILMEQDKPLDSLKAAMSELDLYVADRDREWPTGPVLEFVPKKDPEPAVMCPGSGADVPAFRGRKGNRCPGQRPVAFGLDTCARCAQDQDTEQGDMIDG